MNVKLCGILQCVLILKSCTIYTYMEVGRAIAQAVSRWIPTVATWVRARVRLCRICGGQIGTWAGFLRVLRFPCQSSFHQLVAAVPSGLSLTPLRTIKK
jgi:hypothetical protein